MPAKKSPSRRGPSIEDKLTQVALQRMRNAASYPRRSRRPLFWVLLAAAAVVTAALFFWWLKSG